MPESVPGCSNLTIRCPKGRGGSTPPSRTLGPGISRGPQPDHTGPSLFTLADKLLAETGPPKLIAWLASFAAVHARHRVEFRLVHLDREARAFVDRFAGVRAGFLAEGARASRPRWRFLSGTSGLRVR